MAQQNRNQSKTSGAAEGDIKITTHPDDFTEQVGPIAGVLEELGKVAEGGGMGPLREAIKTAMPEDKVYGEVFVTTMKRMRDAAEQAFNVAREEHWAKHRR